MPAGANMPDSKISQRAWMHGVELSLRGGQLIARAGSGNRFLDCLLALLDAKFAKTKLSVIGDGGENGEKSFLPG